MTQNRLRDAKECEACDEKDVSKFSWCNACGMILCNTCWDQQAPHKKKGGKFRENAIKHEKTELRTAALIYSILRGWHEGGIEAEHGSKVDEHEDNLATKWFGVSSSNEEFSKPKFYIFERFRSVVLYGDRVDSANQFPSIVSFVGETGAGKSTLINAMIKVNSWTHPFRGFRTNFSWYKSRLERVRQTKPWMFPSWVKR
jgi:ABC-type glutathione transport system ATPase component